MSIYEDLVYSHTNWSANVPLPGLCSTIFPYPHFPYPQTANIFAQSATDVLSNPAVSNSQMTQSIRKTFDECLELIRSKNHDYAGPDNEYRNFEAATRIGLNVQQSIMLRLQDKISRLENLMTKDAAVSTETFSDTIADAINYLAILKARREFEQASVEK